MNSVKRPWILLTALWTLLQGGVAQGQTFGRVDLPPNLCEGEQVQFTFGYQEDADIFVGQRVVTINHAERIFLPDGVPCGSMGCSYTSPIEFTQFRNTDTVRSVNDIRYLRLNIEHSYIGDLYIKVTCPSGQQADILRFGGYATSNCASSIPPASVGWYSGSNSTSADFGMANTYYTSSNKCDSSTHPTGTGWNYCWSDNTSEGYSYAGSGGYVYRTVNQHNGRVDSSHVATGTQFYHPDQSFASLVGCPLNGDWSITVQDGWGGDDGYLFEWELVLSTEYSGYNCTLVERNIEGPYITRVNDSLYTVAVPPIDHDTTVDYWIWMLNSCGDTIDTVVNIAIRGVYSLEADTAACDVFQFLGSNYYISQRIDHNFHSIYGCDSILHLNLTVNPSRQEVVPEQACDSLLWHGTVYSASGDYPYATTTTAGCDSTATLRLDLLRSTGSEVYDTVVENHLPRLFNGQSFAEGGDYSLVIPNAAGCDSVIGYHLLVHWNTEAVADSTVCFSALPLPWNGHTFTAPAPDQPLTLTQTVTLLTPHGADSVLTMRLTVNPEQDGHRYDTICDNESLTFSGVTYTQAGVYPHHFLNQYGCDSLSSLHLSLRATSASTTLATACDSLVWNGRTCAMPGEYHHLTTNAAGCDSTATLRLTLHYSQHQLVSMEACDSLEWNGAVFYASGDSLFRYTSAEGCDSTVRLVAAVFPTPEISVTPDTIILLGQSLTLGASGAEYYQWMLGDSVMVHTPTLSVSPATSTCYRVLGGVSTANEVQNGDFEQGNTAFSTAYTYSTNLFPEGNYYVGQNAQTYHAGFRGTDHTSGSGNFFICNGSGTPNTNVWTQTVSVIPHTTYAFSTWVCALSNYPESLQALLQFRINGTLVGAPFRAPVSTGEWRQYYELWNSGDNTQATISIVNQNTVLGGNDFGIDDISLHRLSACMAQDSVWVLVKRYADSTVCQSALPLSWNGHTFDAAPSPRPQTLTHEVTFAGHNGADSIVIMRLTVNPEQDGHRYDTICDNESLTFSGVTYTQAGVYPHHFLNQYGCDSLSSLHLSLRATSASTTLATACDSYEWNGAEYTASGVYTYGATNAAGCDSTATLELTVSYASSSSARQTVCDSLTWNGATYSTSGEYVFVTTNAVGCDSTATLSLTVHYSSASAASHSDCDSYHWNGETYTASGVYLFHTTNAAGCDSTATLNLSIRLSSSSAVFDTIVENNLPRAFLGESFSHAGDYTFTIPNTMLCDSTIAYHLHVWPNSAQRFDSTICDNQLPLLWCDSLFTTAGQRTTLHSDRHGADSLVTLHLTVHSTYDHHTYDTLCQGSTRPFGGNLYGSTGIYEHSYRSAHNCDSLSTLHLTIHAITYDTVSDTILENQLPYTFNGHLCLDSDTFSITIPNTMGCDSNITYHLMVHRNCTIFLDSAVCDSQLPFLWDDTLFTSSSLVHTKHLSTRYGADSIVVMRLTAHPTYHHHFTRSVCADALPFSWQGFEYEADPDTLPYSHNELLIQSLTSHHQCDSTVSLALSVNLTSTSTTIQTHCDRLLWNGTEYILSGTYEHHMLNALGCDSLATLTLTLHYSDTTEETVTSCGPYLWNGQGYTRTGEYHHLTQTFHGCDSLCVLHLRVPTIESERSEAHCDSLRWNGQLYTSSGTYTQQFTSTDGCDSVATLLLTIHRSSEEPQQVTLCEGDLPYTYNEITFPYGTQRGEQRIPYTDRHGCDSVILLQLDIYYNPVLRADMLQYRCYEHEFELQATLSPEAGELTWSSVPHDPTTLGREHDNPMLVSPHQPTVYTATAQVPGTGCQNSLSVTTGPIVDLKAALRVTPEYATPQQSELTLRDQSRGTVRSWLWKADGDEVGDRPVCQYLYPLERDSVEISLIVTEPRYGCRDTATAVVPLLGGDLFVPNVFTPDESSNQRFVVKGRNIVDFELSIYARNGLRVYYSVDMDEGWDGRNQARHLCPEGAYVYLIRYTTTESPHNPLTKRGSVLLLR